MDPVKVTINNKNFILAFGMKFFRVLGQRLETKTLMQTQEAVLKVLSTFSEQNPDLSFEQMDMINHLIIAAVESYPENTETITANELDDLVLIDTKSFLEIVTQVMSGFVASLPKTENPEPSGKGTAPKKASNNPNK